MVANVSPPSRQLKKNSDFNLGYCGNSIAASAAPANIGDCNQLCAGSAFEYCGNGNRLDVYVLNGTTTASSIGTTSGTVHRVTQPLLLPKHPVPPSFPRAGNTTVATPRGAMGVH
jgi:hypothetical protein